MSNIDIEKTQEEAKKASQLPDPKGYRILCAVPHVEEEYEGGIGPHRVALGWAAVW